MRVQEVEESAAEIVEKTTWIKRDEAGLEGFGDVLRREPLPGRAKPGKVSWQIGRK